MASHSRFMSIALALLCATGVGVVAQSAVEDAAKATAKKSTEVAKTTASATTKGARKTAGGAKKFGLGVKDVVTGNTDTDKDKDKDKDKEKDEDPKAK